MSYEYSVVFEDVSAVGPTLDRLLTSRACAGDHAGALWLKDPELHSQAEYDASISQHTDRSLWLQVNLQSPGLHVLLLECLNGAIVRCYEDGEDEVTLAEAFRLRADPGKSDEPHCAPNGQ